MLLRLFAAALLALLIAHPAAAQQPAPAMSDAEAEVMAPITRLFDGMRASDTSMVASAFHPLATLYTVAPDNEGEVAIRETPVDQFVGFLAQPHDEVYDERLGTPSVRIDDDLATVWVPYAFYVGETFSHCGVNAFQLAYTRDEWRVLHASDTRRRENCDPSVER